jgi:hypothetical protein
MASSRPCTATRRSTRCERSVGKGAIGSGAARPDSPDASVNDCVGTQCHNSVRYRTDLWTLIHERSTIRRDRAPSQGAPDPHNLVGTLLSVLYSLGAKETHDEARHHLCVVAGKYRHFEYYGSERSSLRAWSVSSWLRWGRRRRGCRPASLPRRLCPWQGLSLSNTLSRTGYDHNRVRRQQVKSINNAAVAVPALRRRAQPNVSRSSDVPISAAQDRRRSAILHACARRPRR